MAFQYGPLQATECTIYPERPHIDFSCVFLLIKLDLQKGVGGEKEENQKGREEVGSRSNSSQYFRSLLRM